MSAAQTSSQSDEWGTPDELMKAVRFVLPWIDLDPASSVEANTHIHATEIFTIKDDALTKEWNANYVFLNPPFGKVGNESKAGIFIAYMLRQWLLGRFVEGIAITHSRPGYEWWERLTRVVPVCLTRQKYDFRPLHERAKTSGSKTSQTIFYFGKDSARFHMAFSPLGRVLYPQLDEQFYELFVLKSQGEEIWLR